MAQGSSIFFLVGPRGSGKTSLGKLLSERLGVPFTDTDALVVSRAGEEIADLVAREGWPAFRALESAVLARLCGKGGRGVGEESGMVVATGGGMVLATENRQRMRESGTVFYLKASPATLAARLDKNPLPGQRPALTDKTPEEEMREVLLEREPLYLECADLVVSSEFSLEEMVTRVVSYLELNP
jgi:shikimate kinase